MNGSSNASFQRKIEEYQARERVYRAGLLEQEAEANQLRRMACDVVAAYGDVSRASVRGALFDPTQNMEVLLLRQQASEKDQQIRQLRDELEANRFDQQTPAGQALMRKCRTLLEENRELGEQIREERMAEFRACLQSEQRLTFELQEKLNESVDFMKELQLENEKLQGTMSRVAGRLREARAEILVVRKERAEMKTKRKREREQQKATLTVSSSPPRTEVSTPGTAPEAPATAPQAIPQPAVAPVAVPPAAESPAEVTAKPEKEKKAKKKKVDKDRGEKAAKKTTAVGH